MTKEFKRYLLNSLMSYESYLNELGYADSTFWSKKRDAWQFAKFLEGHPVGYDRRPRKL